MKIRHPRDDKTVRHCHSIPGSHHRFLSRRASHKSLEDNLHRKETSHIHFSLRNPSGRGAISTASERLQVCARTEAVLIYCMSQIAGVMHAQAVEGAGHAACCAYEERRYLTSCLSVVYMWAGNSCNIWIKLAIIKTLHRTGRDLILNPKLRMLTNVSHNVALVTADGALEQKHSSGRGGAVPELSHCDLNRQSESEFHATSYTHFLPCALGCLYMPQSVRRSVTVQDFT
jgi:hypothetical protein